jgi:CheY-like chemotaxis protein
MKRVLVVDDDKLLRGSLAKFLGEHGYEVIEASDGKDALAKAERNIPDFVITDIMMPQLDGIEMLEKMRTTPWGKNLPAVVLTIKDSDLDNINKSMQSGILAYLSKADISPEQILSILDQNLKDTQTP